jgi:hypothetical protein
VRAVLGPVTFGDEAVRLKAGMVASASQSTRWLASPESWRNQAVTRVMSWNLEHAMSGRPHRAAAVRTRRASDHTAIL